MTNRAMTAVGIVCPGFGPVSDKPPKTNVLLTSPGSCDDQTISLQPHPICVKIARNHTTAALTAWGLNDHIPNATLVISELVTNALRHAMPPGFTPGSMIGNAACDAIALRLVRRDRDVMCLVADSSDRLPVPTDFAAETGRGLHIVAAHSFRWDWAYRRHRPGKWVWALLRSAVDASR